MKRRQFLRAILALLLAETVWAQEIGRVTLVVDKAHYSATAVSSWSGGGAIAKALASIPSGASATIQVPAGYQETTTVTNTIPVSNVTIQFAAGAALYSGASSVPVFTCTSGVSNVTLTGPGLLDGGYGAHGYTGNDAIDCDSSTGLTVDGLTFQNFYARGIYCSTSCAGASFVNNTFSAFGNGSQAGGYEAIRVDNPDHVKVDDNFADGLTTDDFLHIFDTSAPPVGAFFEIERNHAANLGRFFIETQVENLASGVVRDNQAGPFYAYASGCLSITAGGSEYWYNLTNPGVGVVIDGNICTQPENGPVLGSANAAEVLSSHAKITNNIFSGPWGNGNVIGGAYQHLEGNSYIGIYGYPITENGLFRNYGASIIANKMINPRLQCANIGTRDSYGDKIAGNHCERQPGYFADDYGYSAQNILGYSLLTTAPCSPSTTCLVLSVASTSQMTSEQFWVLTGVTGTGLVSPQTIQVYVLDSTHFIAQGLVASGTYTIAGGANVAFPAIDFVHWGNGFASGPIDFDSNEAILTPPPGGMMPGNFTWTAGIFGVVNVPGTTWRNNTVWNQTSTAIGNGIVQNAPNDFAGETICGNNFINVATITNIPNTEAVSYNTCGPNQSLGASAIAWDSGTLYDGSGELVLSGGTVYISILAGTNHVPPNATYWDPVTSAPGVSWLITPTTYANRGYGANGSTNYCSDCGVDANGALYSSGAGAQYTNVNGALVGLPTASPAVSTCTAGTSVTCTAIVGTQAAGTAAFTTSAPILLNTTILTIPVAFPANPSCVVGWADGGATLLPTAGLSPAFSASTSNLVLQVNGTFPTTATNTFISWQCK